MVNVIRAFCFALKNREEKGFLDSLAEGFKVEEVGEIDVVITMVMLIVGFVGGGTYLLDLLVNGR